MHEHSSSGRKHPDADCDGCPLYKAKYVPNDLPIDATVAFVGEAPGAQEAKQGAPFVGPSGKLLHRAAESAGITNPAQLNVVGCRPPGNRTPTAIEIRHCKGRLQGDLGRLIKLETVVTLGGTATKVLTGEAKVTQARVGPPKQIDDLKVIPTFHPAYCLRNGNGYPDFKADLRKVNAPPSKWQPPNWTLYDDSEGALQFLDNILSFYPAPMVIDIEVGIEKDTDFAHPERYQLLCIGIVWDGHVVVIGEEALRNVGVRNGVSKAINHHKVICHNGKFDLTLWPEVDLYFDTMLASYVCDERPGTNSLEYNATEILGSPNWKGELDKYLGEDKNYASIPRDVLYPYNAYDIWNTWLLFKHFMKVMTDEELALHDVLCRLSQVLMHAEMKGSALDFEYLKGLDSSMQEELEGLEKATQRWVDNPRSPKQVKEAFEQLKVKLNDTQEDTLIALQRKTKKQEVLDFIDAILSYREKQKLHSTYVKGLLKREYEGRINTSFLIHGTTTGRLSSRNPNIQNQPRGPLIRTAFIPDPGFVYVQADYKTAELRVIAVESGDPWLLDVLSDPARDIHGEVADQFYGPGAWNKDQRVRAKAVVFGVSYDRQAESIAKEYGITHEEAQGAIDAFFGLMPQAVEWRERLVDRVMHDGWDPVNHFGRTRRFHLITRDNMRDVRAQTLAFIPQSTANDICFRAAIRLWEEYRYDIRILVHDSILVQCLPHKAREVGITMARVMQQTAAEEYSDSLPFYVDIETGPNWGALS